MTTHDEPAGVPWTIAITQEAFDVIADEVHLGGTRLETGGILLGDDDVAARRITVAVAGGPGPNAVRQPHRFSRDRKYAEELALRGWESRHTQWIGEWHTHTCGTPVPSPTDLTTYLGHLRDTELNFAHFVSLIVAVTADRPPTLVAWLVDTQEAQQIPLHLIPEEP